MSQCPPFAELRTIKKTVIIYFWWGHEIIWEEIGNDRATFYPVEDTWTKKADEHIF